MRNPRTGMADSVVGRDVNTVADLAYAYARYERERREAELVGMATAGLGYVVK